MAMTRPHFSRLQRIESLVNRVKRDDNGCWIWIGDRINNGYGIVKIRIKGSPARKNITAHRLSWRLFRGKIPKGMDVLHRCDVKNCVNPEHLWIGTHSDNMKDMHAKGRWKRVHRRLFEAEVIEIRRMHKGGAPRKDIADRFGISPSQVANIVTGRLWSRLPQPED